MNRRELLAASAGAAVSLVGLNRCRSEQSSSSPGKPPSGRQPSKIRQGGDRSAIAGGRLAGRTLEQLREQYRHDLFGDFLPFMDRHIIDHKLGGFMCNADRNGTKLNTIKNTWYIGRGIWVYSYLYNELGARKKDLEVARKATEFILRNPPADDELWFAECTKEGKPIKAKGQYIGGKYVPVSKQIYGDLFIANGLAEYGRAVGQGRYWEMAKKLMQKCIGLYDRPDYDPTAPKVYLGRDDAAEMPGVRLLGVWMLLLRLGTQMLNQREDAGIRAVVDRSLDAIFNHHYNPDYDLLNEVLTHDMSRPDNEYRDLVYTGHGIEALWMVLYEAHRRKDEKLFKKAARLFRRTMEVAWDDVYGGFFRGVKNVDENTWILDKALWVQEEALIGTLFIIEQTGAHWAAEWFSKIFTYVHKHFPLKKHGFALWDLWPDRKATFVEHYSRIGNFHHPRHLMLNLCCLQRMIRRQGKASGSLAD